MLCGVMPQAWAESPPVVDLSIDGAASSEQVADQEATQAPGRLRVESVASSEQSVGNTSDPALLKQQITNYLRMNLPEKIEALQQEVAQLRGQLEVQAHDLKMLKEQQQQYDQNLGSRIAQEKLVSANKAVSLDEDKVEATQNLSSHSKVKAEPRDEQKEQQAYNKAFNLIKEKKYSQAIEELKEFLKAYPAKKDGSSQYALNAYYWLGELYFLQGQFDQAATQFKVIVKKFPGKPKVPDAMLKLGLISANLGKKAEAKQTFQDIKKRFPDSSAAHTAALELQKL